jgi:trehalose-phosphatase
MGGQYHNGAYVRQKELIKKGVIAKKTIHLFSDWNRIKKSVSQAFLYLFLDYDGTLAPIVDRPYMATMPWRTRKIISELSAMKSCKVAVISGRLLSDVIKRVGIRGIVYAGNHGLEIKGPKIAFRSPLSAGYRVILTKIRSELRKKLKGIKGARIEDKGLSLSFHFRLVSEDDMPLAKALFYETIIVHEVRGRIKVRPGKKIFEIRPAVDWDKGDVVLWLLARQTFAMSETSRKPFPVYIGDDVTDEDAFEALKNKGMTVRVGRYNKTTARYYLRNPGEVTEFLGRLAGVLRESKGERA